MAIEAVKIPQNVYVEDRIIGPITLKQLLIVGIGAGFSYAIYAMVTKAGFKEIPIQIMCWVPAVIAAAFAFMKVNDLSLFNIILLMIEGMTKPKQRYWSPHQGISINLITRQAVKEIDTAQAKASETGSKLADITRQMEKRQAELNKLSSYDITKESPAVVQEKVKAASMNDIIAPAAEVSAPPVPTAPVAEERSSLPVNKNRIAASGLDPARSVDGISLDLPVFNDYSPVRP